MKSAPNPAHVIYAIPSPRKILSQLLQIRNSLRPLSIGCKTNLGDLLQNRLWFTLWHFKSVICGIYRFFFFVPCSPYLVPWDKLVSKVQVLSQNHGVAMLLDVKWGTSQYCLNSVRQANKSYDSSCLLEINEFCLYFLREQEINWSQCLSWNAETEIVSAYFQLGLTG